MEHPVILYDGECGFCGGVVRFVLARDTRGVFRFAPLQSDKAIELLSARGIAVPRNPSTFYLLLPDRVLTKSTAGIEVLARLPRAWRLARSLMLLPRPVRDLVYTLIAKNRHHFPGSRTCMVPDPQHARRFLV